MSDAKAAWLERVLGFRPEANAARSGVLAEIQMRREREVYGRFNPDFSTYRDAPGTRVSAEDQAELREVTDQMIVRARAMREAQEEAGDPVDLEAIEKTVFGHIPRGMIPPEFVQELQDWRRVRDAFSARSVKAMSQEKAALDYAKSGASVGSGMLTLANLGAKATKALAPLAPEHIAAIGTAIVAMTEAGNALDGVGSAVDGAIAAKTDPPTDLQERMRQDKILDGLLGVAKSGASIAGDFVPVVSVVKNSAECMLAVRDVAARLQLQAATGELKDKALLDLSNQLAKAFAQSQRRERRMAAEAGMNVTTGVIGTAGGIATATGVGATVGGALTIANGVISAAGKAVFFGIDQVAANKAVATLNRARAGDTEAQQEVFKDNAHYAKMLIAKWAYDGNPLATEYLVDRGITEADLRSSSNTADILFDYAVSQSGETDEQKTLGQKVREGLDAVSGIASSIKNGCESAARKILNMKEKPVEPAPSFDRLPSGDDIAAMYRRFREAKRQYDAATPEEREADPGLAERVARLKEQLDDIPRQLRELWNVAKAEQDFWFRVDLGVETYKGSGKVADPKAKAEQYRAMADLWSDLYAKADALSRGP